jgi:hypothetical protein
MKHSLYRLKDLLAAFACELLKPLKISFIVGSKMAFFSLAQCTFPLIGFYGGMRSVGIAFGARTLYAFASGVGLYAGLFYHIPTLCGSFYLGTSSKLVRIALPLTCMVLFVAHPIGGQAWGYTLYWLIPMLAALIPHRSFFITALGTTFTMHAVGSVLWLYTRQLDPSVWYGLTGIVWAERIVFAACMTALHYSITFIRSVIPQAKERYHALYKTLHS